VLGVVIAASFVAAVLGARTRGAALLLGGVLGVQLLAWLTLTHIQSRFLLPIVAPGAAMVALAWHGWRGDGRARGMLAWAMIVVVITAQAGLLVRLWTTQRGGEPGAMIVPGVRSLVGLPASGDGGVIAESFLDRPEAMMNRRWLTRMGIGNRLYMLGGSTPMYFIGDVVGHTTWDTSPLGEAIRAHGDDPEAWTRALRARGISHVLIDLGEIGRLRASGDAGADGARRGWYDPDVTLERAMEWGATLVPVRVWEDRGMGLFLVRASGGGVGRGALPSPEGVGR
jgi:hypothetical protein